MKNKIRISLILILTLILWGLTVPSVQAQQDSQYTQYMYNTQTVNPAYAGSRGLLSLNGLYRAQWVGIDDAPKTINFSGNTPIGEKTGLGLSFYSDKIGISDESNITLDFSYTIPLSYDTETYLAFGVKGGFNILNVDFSKLNPNNPSSPEFNPDNNINNQSDPVIGAGIYLRNSDKWYLGLSIPNFLETDHYEDITISTAKERMTYYLIGGYVFEVNPNLKFKPAFLLKAEQGAPLAADVSGNFLINDRFILGAAYRWNSAISGLLGFQLSDSILLGYAYDHDLTDIGNYDNGSHEFFIRFELLNSGRGVFNPRFF